MKSSVIQSGILAGSFVIFALGGALDLQATIITKNNVTIASDTYEGDTVGVDPVADVGTWTGMGSRPLGDVTNAGSPGAFNGSQYVLLPGHDSPPALGGLGASMTLAPGDTVQFDSMVYVPGAAMSNEYPWQFTLFNEANNHRLFTFYRYSSGVWEGFGSTFAGPSSFAADVWQRWTVNYTVGAANAVLTIDGVSINVPAENTGLAGHSDFKMGVFTNGWPNSPLYLDSVPEPSSLALAGLGALAMRRARRQ